MSRISRSRSRILSVSGPGTITNLTTGLVTVVGPYTNSKEACVDSHGTPWSDSTLSVGKGKWPRVHLNGTRVSFLQTYKYQDVPINPGDHENWTVTPWQIHDSVAGPKFSTSTLAAKALANANPNTPEIDLPVSILELRELPSLLRDAGSIALRQLSARNVSKASAKAIIMGEFGIQPVIRDVLTLMDFAEKVAARERYLMRLNSAEPIRIKRTIAKQSWDTSVTKTHTPGYVIRLQYLTTSTYWYTIRGHLTVLLSQRDIETAAFRAVLGTGPPSVSSLWQLLPWSWLIDWFSTLGDLLAAYRTGIPFTWSNVNIMCRTEYKVRGTFTGYTGTIKADMANPEGFCVHKTRTPVPIVWPYPSWKIPYLSGNQLSILGSLLILRL